MAVIDYNQLPNLDIFGVFICHFILSSWSMFSSWCPLVYAYYNIIILVTLLWCLKDTHNELPLILSIRVNAIAIVMDFVILIVYFPYNWWTHIFSIVGAIINLLMRFITIPILSKFCYDRTNGTNDGLPHYLVPIFGNSDFSRRDPYEDIDVPRQSYPRTETVVVAGTHSYTPKNPPPYQS